MPMLKRPEEIEESSYAYVGCFTTERRRAHGKGISVFRIREPESAWELLDVLETKPNPHFLCLDKTQKFLYSAHGDSSDVCSYAIRRQTGQLTFLNSQPTRGDNSSYLMPDPGNRYIVLANGPGVAVFPRNEDGSLAPMSDLFMPTGQPGPYRNEQTGSHPHQARFDSSGRWVVAPDKGLDRIHLLRFDEQSGRIVPANPASTKAKYGAAPRHVAFHPSGRWAYVINELGSTVVSYNWNAEVGSLEPFQILPTTPDTYTGDNTGAEIEVASSGRYVYASNRGHNSIVAFAVDEVTGRLTTLDWHSVEGDRPRFFTLNPAGSHLYVANQNSHTIVTFEVDAGTGRVTPTGQVIETGSPSCIVFTS